jgi:hypothetical protein
MGATYVYMLLIRRLLYMLRIVLKCSDHVVLCLCMLPIVLLCFMFNMLPIVLGR